MQPLFSPRMSNRFSLHESRQRAGGRRYRPVDAAEVTLKLEVRSGIAVNSPFRFRQISFVDFKSEKSFNATALRCDRGITDAEKGIQHGSDARRSVQFDAPFGELNRECRRMRPFFFAALNCLVRHKPSVPAATQIVSPSMTPARDVALVLIRHAKREPIKFH